MGTQWDVLVATLDLGDVLSLQKLCEKALEREVWELRAEGRSWGEVGERLGVTRQAAHQRWRYVDDLELD